MTDIATLGTLLRLARDTVSNPREGAVTVLSFAPGPRALWLMLALVVVVSLILGEILFLLTGGAAGATLPGAAGRGALALGLVQAALLVIIMHAIHRIGRLFGGTGRFEEAMLLVIWLQFIFICVQIVQLAALVLLPPVAGLVTLLAIGLFFWLLVNFIAVLHGFTSLGMVFVMTLFSGVALLFALSLVLTLLGLVPEAGAP